jgi:ketosteroid isomerase-like protein
MGQTESKTYVKQTQEQFWMALQNKDRSVMASVLADDFLARSPGQPNQGRAEFIDSLTSFPAQVLSIRSDDLEIHIWGDVAVVTGVQSAEVKFANGQIKMNRIAITNVFQYQQERWIMRLSHAVALE